MKVLDWAEGIKAQNCELKRQRLVARLGLSREFGSLALQLNKRGPRLGAQRYRPVAALLNYMVVGRAVTTYITKEGVRHVSKPSMKNEAVLARFCQTRMQRFVWQRSPNEAAMFVDCDVVSRSETGEPTPGDMFPWPAIIDALA